MLGPPLSDLKFRSLQALARPRHSTLRGLGATAPDRYLGLRKRHFSFLLLGIVDGHVVIENDKQEERHAQHVGEDGELHVCDHPAAKEGLSLGTAHPSPRLGPVFTPLVQPPPDGPCDRACVPLT